MQNKILRIDYRIISGLGDDLSTTNVVVTENIKTLFDLPIDQRARTMVLIRHYDLLNTQSVSAPHVLTYYAGVDLTDTNWKNISNYLKFENNRLELTEDLDLYVSATGNDNNDGSQANPKKTLYSAMLLLSSLLINSNVRVFLDGSIHQLDSRTRNAIKNIICHGSLQIIGSRTEIYTNVTLTSLWGNLYSVNIGSSPITNMPNLEGVVIINDRNIPEIAIASNDSINLTLPIFEPNGVYKLVTLSSQINIMYPDTISLNTQSTSYLIFDSVKFNAAGAGFDTCRMDGCHLTPMSINGGSTLTACYMKSNNSGHVTINNHMLYSTFKLSGCSFLNTNHTLSRVFVELDSQMDNSININSSYFSGFRGVVGFSINNKLNQKYQDLVFVNTTIKDLDYLVDLGGISANINGNGIDGNALVCVIKNPPKINLKGNVDRLAITTPMFYKSDSGNFSWKFINPNYDYNFNTDFTTIDYAEFTKKTPHVGIDPILLNLGTDISAIDYWEIFGSMTNDLTGEVEILKVKLYKGKNGVLYPEIERTTLTAPEYKIEFAVEDTYLVITSHETFTITANLDMFRKLTKVS